MNQFEGRPQNTPEQSASPEGLELTSIRDIFTEGYDDTSVTVIRTDPSEHSYVIEKNITGGEVEGNAQVGIMSQVEKLDGSESVWEVKGLVITTEHGVLSMSELLPEGSRLFIDPEESDHYNMSTKEVSIDSLRNIEDIFTLLHEVGHAQDFNNEPRVAGEFSAGSPMQLEQQIIEKFMSEPEKVAELIRLGMARERNAWAGAIQIVRKYMPEFQQKVHADSRECLKTYDRSIASAVTRGSDFRSFASSDQRASMRSKEREFEALATWRLGLRMKMLKNKLEGITSISLTDTMNSNNPVFFNDPRQGDEYALMFSDNSAIISCSTKIREDNKIPRFTSAFIHGHETIQANIEDIVYNEDTKSAESIPWFNGRIELLKTRGGSANAPITYQVIFELFDRLEDPAIQESLAIQVFRGVYPDAPEPYNINSITGEEYSLDQKMDFMRAHSDKYQQRNNPKINE